MLILLNKIKIIWKSKYYYNFRFDFIISNPPYIKQDRKFEMQKEVILYEDERSLFSGIEGLDLIKEIVIESKSILKEKGFVVLEVDEFHSNEIINFLIEKGIFNFFFEKDIFEKNRFLIFSI